MSSNEWDGKAQSDLDSGDGNDQDTFEGKSQAILLYNNPIYT